MTEQNPTFQWLDDNERHPTDEEKVEAQNSGMEELDLQFAQNFTAIGGKFIYCESATRLFQMLNSLKEQHEWNYIFAWTHSLRELMIKYDFQQGEVGFLLDNSDAAISFCDSLIADSGSIMLSPDQATNRKLTTFPSHHIIIANKQSFVPDLESAIATFNKNYYNRLPSIVELNPDKPIYKANHSRILNAEGTKDIYVFYIDSKDFE